MRVLHTAAVAALALAASLSATRAASAQAYGYLPAPAYVGAGVDYGSHRRFTLAGARAGITVLGIDLDAGANLKIGLHGDHGRRVVYAAPPAPAPQPVYAGGGYDYGPGYGGGYAQQTVGYGGGYATGYEQHATGYIPAPQPYPYPMPYPSPCGC